MRWLLVLPLLVSCGEVAEKPVRTPTARALAAEKRIQEGPDARTYSVRGGELLVIEVPVKDQTGWVDSQRCFVWRDAEFRASSISCGQQPDVMLTSP